MTAHADYLRSRGYRKYPDAQRRVDSDRQLLYQLSLRRRGYDASVNLWLYPGCTYPSPITGDVSAVVVPTAWELEGYANRQDGLAMKLTVYTIADQYLAERLPVLEAELIAYLETVARPYPSN